MTQSGAGGRGSGPGTTINRSPKAHRDFLLSVSKGFKNSGGSSQEPSARQGGRGLVSGAMETPTWEHERTMAMKQNAFLLMESTLL